MSKKANIILLCGVAAISGPVSYISIEYLNANFPSARRAASSTPGAHSNQPSEQPHSHTVQQHFDAQTAKESITPISFVQPKQPREITPGRQVKPAPSPQIRLTGNVLSLDNDQATGSSSQQKNNRNPITFGSTTANRDTVLQDDKIADLPILTPSSEGDKYITFNFQDAPWPTVLKAVAGESGFALEMRAMPPGKFTYHDSVPRSVSDALDILNAFLIRDGHILIRFRDLMVLLPTSVPIPPHIIEQVPLAELTDRGQYELITVKLVLSHLSPELAASQVSGLLTPLGRATPVEISRTLLITDLRKHLERAAILLIQADREAGHTTREVVHLKNVQANKVVESIQQILKTNSNSATAPAASASAHVVTPNIVAIEETNSVIISASPSEMARLQRLIRTIDVPPLQVYIKALIVEVELGSQDEFGVEVAVQDSLLFRRSVVDDILTTTQTQTSPNGAQTTSENIISSQTLPGFNFNNQPIGNNTAANPARLAGQVLSNLAVGRVNADVGYGGFVLAGGSDSISLLLRALAAERKVTVLSRPNIRTVDNRPATIQMGAQVPVVDGVSVTANGNANPVVRQDKSGIILEVTPKISEAGSIFMEVRAEKSSFRSGPGSGTPIFVDASSGNVIESPIKDIVEANATIAMNSGQTIVLGGMITSEDIQIKRKVPVLGDLPVVGNLFKYDLHTVQRKELLIFLTPQILLESSLAIDSEELRQSSADVNKLVEFYHGRGAAMLPGYSNISPAGELDSKPAWFRKDTVPDESIQARENAVTKEYDIDTFFTPQ
jgi:type II secretory pathway component GspD/PulD (secretin)